MRIKTKYQNLAITGFVITLAVAILAFYYVFQANVGLSYAGTKAYACLGLTEQECAALTIIPAEYIQCGCLKLSKQNDGDWRKSSVYTSMFGMNIGGNDYSDNEEFTECLTVPIEEKNKCVCNKYCTKIQPQNPGSTKTLFWCVGAQCSGSIYEDDIPEEEIIEDYGPI